MKVRPRRKVLLSSLLAFVCLILGVAQSHSAAYSDDADPEDSQEALVARIEAQAAPLNDAAESVDTFLKSTSWAGFSATGVGDHQIIVRGRKPIPRGVRRQAESLAGEFSIEEEIVPFTEAEYLAVTDKLVEALGDDKVQLKRVSMRDGKEIQIEILRSDRTRQIEQTVRRILVGFPLRISYAPADDPGPQLLGSRWNDENPFSGGAQISSSVLGRYESHSA